MSLPFKKVKTYKLKETPSLLGSSKQRFSRLFYRYMFLTERCNFLTNERHFSSHWRDLLSERNCLKTGINGS